LEIRPYRVDIETKLSEDLARKKAALDAVRNQPGANLDIAMNDYSDALKEFTNFVLHRVIPERLRDTAPDC
jgi:hypothetical protein